MTAAVQVVWEDAEFQAAARRLMDLGSDLSPMMEDIAEGLLHSTQDRFDTKTAPDGQPWAPLTSSTQAMKKGPGILDETGNLRRDGLHHSWGADYAEIGATPPYARWHQEGTQPYVILPTAKKALAFGPAGKKVVRKKVKHPGLPARPFIGVSNDDAQMIRDKAAIALKKATEGSP